MKKICLTCIYAEPENIDKEYDSVLDMIKDEEKNDYKLFCCLNGCLQEDDNTCKFWVKGVENVQKIFKTNSQSRFSDFKNREGFVLSLAMDMEPQPFEYKHSNQKKYWITKEGKKVLFQDMELSHIKNTINMLLRKNKHIPSGLIESLMEKIQ